MDIDAVRTRGKLTSEERAARLQNNQCLYCGVVGHKVEACTKRPSQGKAATQK
jgi:hypothetical protein